MAESKYLTVGELDFETPSDVFFNPKGAWLISCMYLNMWLSTGVDYTKIQWKLRLDDEWSDFRDAGQFANDGCVYLRMKPNQEPTT